MPLLQFLRRKHPRHSKPPLPSGLTKEITPVYPSIEDRSGSSDHAAPSSYASYRQDESQFMHLKAHVPDRSRRSTEVKREDSWRREPISASQHSDSHQFRRSPSPPEEIMSVRQTSMYQPPPPPANDFYQPMQQPMQSLNAYPPPPSQQWRDTATPSAYPEQYSEPRIEDCCRTIDGPKPYIEPQSRPMSPGTPVQCIKMCEQCDTGGIPLWYCGICTIILCDDCWDGQLVHRKARGRPGAPHEKTPLDVAEKVGKVLTPPDDESGREQRHRADELTAWFGECPTPHSSAPNTNNDKTIGIERLHDSGPLFLQEYSRMLDLLSEWRANPNPSACDRMTPSLVSFVGQTGAGKSSLVKLLIDIKTKGKRRHSTPIIGPRGNHLPTSEDVHLYLDPSTEKTPCPILLADCEGLDGGEREPLGAKFKKKWRDEDERAARLDEAFFKAKGVISEYELQWSTKTGCKSRGFAVTHLYPRLLYAFSDVIVFVLRNPRYVFPS